ncbi:hypothetical protein DFH29DRAFT_819195 [Suillus ampliporus]|nr:hypothetical protein DFH29DRAFT_819195 [Suillus ampliporus]
MENDIPCSCNTLTLQSIEIMVEHWRKDWTPEEMWNKVYEEVLAHAREKGEQETMVFLDECGRHIWEGRILLDNIRDVVHTNCPYCREQVKYDVILLYDMLVHVTSKVKFFEVKVDVSRM